MNVFSKIFVILLILILILICVRYVFHYRKRAKMELAENIDKFTKSLQIERVIEWKSDDEITVGLFTNMTIDTFFEDLRKFFKKSYKIYKVDDKIEMTGKFWIKLRINLEYENPYANVYFLLDVDTEHYEDIFKFLNLRNIFLNILTKNPNTEFIENLKKVLFKYNKDFVVIDKNSFDLGSKNVVIVDKNDTIFEITDQLMELMKSVKENENIFILGRMSSKNLAFTIDDNMLLFNKKRIKFKQFEGMSDERF